MNGSDAHRRRRSAGLLAFGKAAFRRLELETEELAARPLPRRWAGPVNRVRPSSGEFSSRRATSAARETQFTCVSRVLSAREALA